MSATAENFEMRLGREGGRAVAAIRMRPSVPRHLAIRRNGDTHHLLSLWLFGVALMF